MAVGLPPKLKGIERVCYYGIPQRPLKRDIIRSFLVFTRKDKQLAHSLM